MAQNAHVVPLRACLLNPELESGSETHECHLADRESRCLSGRDQQSDKTDKATCDAKAGQRRVEVRRDVQHMDSCGPPLRMFVHIPSCYFRVAILFPKRNQFVVALEPKEAAGLYRWKADSPSKSHFRLQEQERFHSRMCPKDRPLVYCPCRLSETIGTLASPSNFAASYRPWPATILLFLSTRIGALKPNASMLLAIALKGVTFGGLGRGVPMRRGGRLTVSWEKRSQARRPWQSESVSRRQQVKTGFVGTALADAAVFWFSNDRKRGS
jgi:hypothetical protein